jgi:hypothetical protein
METRDVFDLDTYLDPLVYTDNDYDLLPPEEVARIKAM